VELTTLGAREGPIDFARLVRYGSPMLSAAHHHHHHAFGASAAVFAELA